VLFTLSGHPLHEAISALQKAVRRGREREAAYWTIEIVQGGFVAYWWRRIQIIASEEASNDLQTCALLGQLAANAETSTKGFRSKKQECVVEVQAAVHLCRAKKSPESIDLVCYLNFARRGGFRIEPHPCAIDMHTRRGRRAGKRLIDFRLEGRRLAGNLRQDDPTDPTYNQYERLLWGTLQEPLARPEEGGDPDIDLPELVIKDPQDPNAIPELPADWTGDSTGTVLTAERPAEER